MIFLMYNPGLGDDASPESDLSGARPFVERLAIKYGAILSILAWNNPKCFQVAQKAILDGHKVIFGGHSHGAWRACQTGKLLVKPTALFMIDECTPFNPFEQLGPSEDFPACDSGYACWQAHVRPFMPNGTKFKPEAGRVDADDCTPWIGPELGHIDWKTALLPDLTCIAADARVWARIESALDRVAL